jgi:hypothetical protein
MVNHDTVHKVADNIAGKYDILLTSFNDITLCAKEYFEKTHVSGFVFYANRKDTDYTANLSAKYFQIHNNY